MSKDTQESLQDVLDVFQDAIKETDEVKAHREARVRELENDQSLQKYPREMSCVTAMDELLQCITLGGQIRHYYRYGELSLCSRQHEKLMFCLKTKLQSDLDRQIAVSKFFQKRFIEDCKKGSSEDIWESR